MANQDRDFYQTLRNKFHDWLQTDAGKKHKYAERVKKCPEPDQLCTNLLLFAFLSVSLGLFIKLFLLNN